MPPALFYLPLFPLFCSIFFPLFLNYTFCHFHPSIHSSITSPPASLFLSEFRAARRSILIEVSWGQTLHSCFTIKCEQKEGDRRKEEGHVAKRKNMLHVGGLLCAFIILLYYSSNPLEVFKEKRAKVQGEKKGWSWVDERTDRADVKGEEEKEKEEERRCGEIDFLANQQFNTTELLLHSSHYEMRSLSLWLLFSLWLSLCLYVCMYMCVSACV